MKEEELKDTLGNCKTVAVVGISPKPDRPSYIVAAYLQSKGYRIIPVNPTTDEILGETAYPDLGSVPEKIDVVQVFRRSEDVPPVVDDAIRAGAKVVWMQEGIVNEEAARKAREAGLQVVMDTCMRSAHRKLIGAQPLKL